MALKSTQITILSLLLAAMLGCTYETRHVQYSLAVRPAGKDAAKKMRGAIEDFSRANGFSSFTQGPDQLQADGRYLLTFRSDDKSYVSVINVVDADCYDIGIYSSVGSKAAQDLGKKLGEILRSTISAKFDVASFCNAA